jgi:serine/threonine-protein phosphatase 5
MDTAKITNQADELKKQGNDCYARGDDTRAAELYAAAIRLDPKSHVLWANRAAALLRLRQFDAALRDAIRARVLDPTYVKVRGGVGS